MGSDREEVNPQQGGRLLRILWWDLACFALSLSDLIGLQVVEGYDEFLSNLFWCRVVYSMLSFPFFFFYLPGLRQLLTHAEATGFAPNGKCVPFKMRENEAAQAAEPLAGRSEPKVSAGEGLDTLPS